jgi:leucyl aminopeptidase
MHIQPTAGRAELFEADALILSCFEDAEPGAALDAVDHALSGLLADLLSWGDFSGKAGEVTVLYPQGRIPARRVIVVGLGKRAAFSLEVIRRAMAQGILKARDLKAKQVATEIHGLGVLPLREIAQAITESTLLALYKYHGQKSTDAPPAYPEHLHILTINGQADEAAKGVASGTAVAAGVQLARDLVNLPPNVCTPSHMAKIALELASTTSLEATILSKPQMEALKMGALLGVTQGSEAPPQFIVLEHNAERTDYETVVLIGKGVTFDTGGYSLKTSDGMTTMKGDMAGGAAVIGAMGAIAGLKLPLRVIGLVPAAENMVSGKAFRPQDVLVAGNGLSIEVMNTDAEGRLLLADALVFAERYKPAAVIDIATLTATSASALGKGIASSLFSTDEDVSAWLMQAGKTTAERVWPMPLYPDYDKALESTTADLKNVGGQYGGMGTSAAFLKRFTTAPRWAHIDMAGMNFDLPDTPYMPKGASGYGVRLLTAFVQEWIANRSTANGTTIADTDEAPVVASTSV